MSDTISVLPRASSDTNVAWIFNTRKYISHYDAHKIYELIYDITPVRCPTIADWFRISKFVNNKRDAWLTANVVVPDFDTDSIKKYINCKYTKDLGVALAIEFRMLEDIINIAENSDIMLYLTEFDLNDSELNLIIEHDLVGGIADRVIDKRKVMYTVLINNFSKLIKLGKHKAINEVFIAKYLEHANFYQGNPFLKYILSEYTSEHPLMSKLDGLAWDPFTKSRRFKHWLRVCSRMDELAKYYLEFNGLGKNVQANKEFILKYLQFQEKYCR